MNTVNSSSVFEIVDNEEGMDFQQEGILFPVEAVLFYVEAVLNPAEVVPFPVEVVLNPAEVILFPPEVVCYPVGAVEFQTIVLPLAEKNRIGRFILYANSDPGTTVLTICQIYFIHLLKIRNYVYKFKIIKPGCPGKVQERPDKR